MLIELKEIKFKLYLYGIEIDNPRSIEPQQMVQIVPLWN